MKKKPFPVLLTVVILTILGGASLFIFKDWALEALRRKTGVNSAAEVSGISATVTTVATSSALDISILKLPRFASLMNRVVNFNFDNICWRPDVVASPVAVSLPDVSETTGEAVAADTGPAHCVQGNSQPFSVKKK